MSIAAIVKDPANFDYLDFYDQVLASVKTSKSIDVIVTSPVKDSVELDFILSTTFTSLRTKLTDLGYDFTSLIDVFYNVDISILSKWNTIYAVLGETDSSSKYIEIKTQPKPVQIPKSDNNKFEFQSLHTSCVGGTFDHIHDGHKILLLMIIFLCSRRMIVGVTGPKLLENKKYAEVLQLYADRQQSVVDYIQLHMFAHTKFEIYMINDICGPTGYVRDMDVLVLSGESAKGGSYVNDYRKSVGLPLLKTFQIAVIGGKDSSAENNWKAKLSSTEIRKKIYTALHDSTT